MFWFCPPCPFSRGGVRGFDLFLAGLACGGISDVQVCAREETIHDGCYPGCGDGSCCSQLRIATFRTSSGKIMVLEEYLDEDNKVQLSFYPL